MADFLTLSGKRSVTNNIQKTTFLDGIGFDRIMALLGCWFVGGLYLDGWAHDHGLADKTFFTPWHAVLYSGYFASAVVLVAALLINHRRGYPWSKAIPGGYELSLLGVPLFLMGGVGDLIWHTLFGIETGIDPLLSPTHLILACSAFLIMSGPFRAAWQRPDHAGRPGWAALFPAILSLLAMLSLFTFFTNFAHPFTETWAVTDFPYTEGAGARGVIDVFLQTAILMSVLLLALRRWSLPVGTMTLLLTINIAFMTVFKDDYQIIVVALLVGIICDLLLWWLKPSTTRLGALRLFSFAVPFVLYLYYFLAIIIHQGGISWTIHLWLGTAVMAGIIGLLLSYLLMPPGLPSAS